MKLLESILLLFISMLLWSCTSQDVAGGETSNMATVGITVYRPDGVTPASGATLKLFNPNNSEGTLIDQRELDENGQYDPSLLKLSTTSPYHNVVIEYDSTEAIFQDSVFITEENRSYLKDDTLALVGAISGVVAIQPTHERIRVLIRALGTDIYTKADSLTGEFVIGGLGEGEYNLMFICEYPEYGVALFDTVAMSGDTTVITDTLDIPFLGIPVVEGISSSYDTLSATATISWEKTNYAELAKYELFRTTDVRDWPTTALAHVTDTSFTDVQTTFGTDSVFYRVRILNKTNESGLEYNQTAILPVSPVEAQTVFSSSLFHIKKQKVTTACSINDSMTVHFGFYNPSRAFSSLSISEWESNKSFDTPVSSYVDSLSLFVTVDTTIIITATDGHGDVWSDTIMIDVVEDAPVIISVDSVVSLNVLDTIHAVVNDEYGEIVKYEWDLDGDGVFEKETTVPRIEIVTSVLDTRISLKGIDDDNIISQSTRALSINIDWSRVGSSPAEINNIPYLRGLFIVDSLFILSEQTSNGYVLWTSTDCVQWEKDSVVLPMKQNLSEIIYHNGEVFALTNILDSSNGTGASIWKTTDLKSWTNVFTSSKVTYSKTKNSMPHIYSKNGVLFCNFIDTLYSYSDQFVANPLYESHDNGEIWINTNLEYSYSLSEGDNWVVRDNETELGRYTFGKDNDYLYYSYREDGSNVSANTMIDESTVLSEYLPRTFEYMGAHTFAFDNMIVRYSPMFEAIMKVGAFPHTYEDNSPYHIVVKDDTFYLLINDEIWASK